MTLAIDVLEAAKSKNVMIVTAESCTGGMVAAALTDIVGSSQVVDRGFVTYSNAAKTDMLDVQSETLKRYGAVSEPVAKEMALGALRHSAARLAISVTGIAGPGGSQHKPEGRVCFACAIDKDLRVETIEFGALGRDQVRAAARDHALRMILTALR
ncbi:CinA family protein [Roseobacter sp. OBYS 0001]|uniref:CinA family protein n=1 Tax=Roseobacter sp. OBYS 0001 TaxID=882651 RepID=UPI001BBE92A9|nr:CinA family protein [Roseobacter sp. OBYS 0001]GIT85733.1 competence damage-inducible protein A [Roseobacter sp. OBYS 0001]